MSYIKFVFPSEDHAFIVQKFIEECTALNSNMQGTSQVETLAYDVWLEKVRQDYQGTSTDKSRVPATTFLVFNGEDTLVGFVNIRHYLNAFLLEIGGHIGYMVRPLQRRKGYAKALLKEALNYCKNELNLDAVLVTCDDDNIGSKKTILASGGQYENTVLEAPATKVERYWIHLDAL